MTENKKEDEIINIPPNTADEDFNLIRRFIEGDETTFRTLVLRHKDKVRNLVFLTIGNRELVDDISQEVFISVFNKLKLFRFESQFTTWLYRITVNKCKDHLRKIRIRSIFVPIKDSDSDTGAEYGTRYQNENVDVHEVVHAAIEKLPEKLRVPLVMREMEGLSYKEIADMLGTEVGTIKSRIFRARETLKILLQPFESELFT